MSGFGLGIGLRNFRRRGSSGGGGAIANLYTYDTSIGNGVDSTGRADLTPRVGAKIFYVNSTTGSDTNTSTQAQNPATPVATIKKAYSYATDGEGDHILIAQGMSYPNGFAYVGDKGGFSAQYPIVFQSYDPADPTNQAKWGTATGSNRPDINITAIDSQSGFIIGLFTAKKYRALRGLKFNGQNVSTSSMSLSSSAGFGTADYILFENDDFDTTELDLQGLSGGSNNGTPVRLLHATIRNCAFHGQWDSGGRGQGTFFAATDGGIIEDSVFVRAGWKEGALRTDAVSVGGPSPQAHPIYVQDDSINTTVRRCVFIDGPSDSTILKGGGIYHDNLSINNPYGPFFGNGNLYSIYAPLGVYIDCRRNALIGNGWGIDTVNAGQNKSLLQYNVLARSGTWTGLTNYGLMADDQSDLSGTGGVTENISLPTYPVFDSNVLYSWAASGGDHVIHLSSGTIGKISDIHATYTNNIWGDPSSGSNINNGSTVFPNSYTLTTLLAALPGAYPDLATAQAAWLADPASHGWRTAPSLMLTGYGVVDPGLIDLTTNMSLTAGYAISGQFLGTHDGSTYTVSGLPSGVTFDSASRCWRYDGTNVTVSSGTFTITETNGTNSHTSTIPWSISAAPVLSSLAGTPGSTTATATVSAGVGTGKLYWMVTTSATTPTWSQVRAGHNADDTNAAAFGAQAISATGEQWITNISGLTASTAYHIYVSQLDGNNNPSVTSAATFTTAAAGTPNLTSASAAGAVSSADLTVTSDAASGTLYWIVSTSATPPSVAQIQAGNDSTGSLALAHGSQAVSATGAEHATATGLTPSTTYYAYFQQISGGSVNSPVVQSGSFSIGATWTPAALGVSNLGGWWEPSDITTLFQDTAGTIPVTADGQSVALIKDKSNSGLDLSQATTANQPVYHTDGTHSRLTFNGTSQFLNNASAFALHDTLGQHTAFATVKPSSASGTQSIFDNDTGGPPRLSQMLRTSSGTSQSIAFNTSTTAFTDSGPSVGSGTVHVLSEKTTTTTVEAFVDGTGNGSTAITGTLQTGSNSFCLGADHGTSQFFAGDWYGGFIYKGVMGSTDMTNAGTYERALAP